MLSYRQPTTFIGRLRSYGDPPYIPTLKWCGVLALVGSMYPRQKRARGLRRFS
ncbi:hypothetical protein [Scytonema sp. PCC 10023]|uniref:hypothetical protein n=1 Tax=Scytonema sp. PCC 10023 TaxID=1680591 RepID=UPI0039C67DD7